MYFKNINSKINEIKMNVHVNLIYYNINFTEEICHKLCQNVTFFVLILI